MKFICARCGLPVVRWANGWKHCANGQTKSCGKAPHAIERAAYEKEMAEVVRTVKI